MKRRILALALVLAAVFSLCACGSSAQSNIVLAGQSVREGKKKLASVENCHLVLRLTINPQLELYLDENGVVLKAEGGNKDGKNLLENLDLTGLSYSEAVSAILSGAEEQEFLKENANVEIDVLSCADGSLSYEQTQLLKQAVTDYDAELTSSVDQSAAVAASCGADMVEIEHAENGDVWYEYYSNMTCIRQVCYGADGSYSEWVYQPWGIASLTTDLIDIDPDGNIHEQHMTYDENGVLTCHQHITQQGDDTRTEEQWFEDGCLSHTIRQDPDGNYEEHTYYSNGNPKTQKFTWADGSYGESTFYANGNPETEKYTGADGTVREDHYYENGNLKFRKETLPDGSSRLEEYNADGAMTSFVNTYANGDWEKEVYYPSGRIQIREGSVGGEYYICNYDENGNLIEE